MEPDKATALANKINKISAKFAEKLDDAEELVVVADDLTIDTQSVLKEVKDLPANMSFNLDLIPQILNLENMMNDVKYIRETLHTSTELGRRLLSVISQEIEFDPNAELLSSYSELSATLTKNMELFLSCYKDISNILINISKLTQQQNPKSVVNNISINSDSKVQSTAELIKQLAQLK